MHDIDRTMMEYESESDEYEAEQEEEFAGEFEAGDDEEYEGESEFEEEYEGEEYAMEGVFSESEEMELASELLTVSDDQELEYFLGKLFKKVGRKARRFVKSKTGRALGRILKRVAKKALPIAGRAVGTAFGGPAGGAIGGRLASRAGRLFGLELEGMSPEDQEFEVARRVVRLAGDAAKVAALAPPSVSPTTAAKVAVVKAAKRHAPGLVKGSTRPTPPMMSGVHSGRWVRRGRKIVLMGV